MPEDSPVSLSVDALTEEFDISDPSHEPRGALSYSYIPYIERLA
jgi:hypothetical protein